MKKETELQKILNNILLQKKTIPIEMAVHLVSKQS